jgi:hypothetical protein
MTLSRMELIVERRTTENFISADPSLITLHRVVEVSDGAGGRTDSDLPRPPQRCRVIPARSRSTSLTYNLPNGMVVSSKDALLVGRWDMEIGTNDWFQMDTSAYQVTFIEPNRQFMTLCQLDLMGASPGESI